MEADDLDDLIADSLGGVETALDADRKAAEAPAASTPAPTDGTNPGTSAGYPAARSAGEAVRELREGPSEGDGGEVNEELFSCLVQTCQDESFVKLMTDALRGTIDSEAIAGGDMVATSQASSSSTAVPMGPAPPPKAGDNGVEDFLQGFLKSLEGANASGGGDFDKELTNLMTSMLSNDLICEPLQQIVDKLEPWLKSQKGLDADERKRYEDQLRLYRKITGIYKSNPDPLPEGPRQEVQTLLAELHLLGQPPDEVMKQISPKEPMEEGGNESFEDFVKSMGLDQGLGSEEKDLLKKLTEDPEELTNALKEMSGSMSEEGCKQQ